jgi:hypothetical protein
MLKYEVRFQVFMVASVKRGYLGDDGGSKYL